MTFIDEDIQLQRLRFWSYAISAIPFMQRRFFPLHSKPPPVVEAKSSSYKSAQLVKKLQFVIIFQSEQFKPKSH